MYDRQGEGLGKKESVLIKSLMEKGENVFSSKRAAEVLGGRKTAVNEMLKGLVQKGWLLRIRKGLYLVVPLEAGSSSRYSEHGFLLASHLASPYYIGFWSALNFHGFTEQVPVTVFIVTTKQVKDRKIFGTHYRFVKRKKLFGFKRYFVAGMPVYVSDREKTVADCFNRPDLCGGISEAVKPLLTEKLDYRKLVDYAKKTSGASLKRICFTLEKLGVEMNAKVNKGYICLDSLGTKKGAHNSKWNIIENVDIEKIRKEVLS